MIGQTIFAIILLVTVFMAWRKYKQVYFNIHLGGEYEFNGSQKQSLKNMFLIAFGQKKMFKRFVPAIFHLFIYVAFLLTQIELIEIIIDGLFGTHRFFLHYLSGFYTFILNFIEVLSLLAFVATFVFLYRRNIMRLARFKKPEMKGWPTLDGNLILFGELALIIGIASMNGADVVLQQMGHSGYPETGTLAVSSWLGPMLFGGLETGTLIAIERFGWWLHILVVFGFLNYLPYSKHLHIFLAFFNTYYAPQESRGHMSNIPTITAEIKSMMGFDEEGAGEEMSMDDDIPEFGVKDVMGFSWKTILDSYTCTECGRCTSVCPANITGKLLSPRKVVMDIRDRAEEVGAKIRSGSDEYKIDKDKPLTKDNFDDGRSLFDYISREELHACTTCNACVEACPVMINPMAPILEMRRYEILTESAGPQEWVPMFTSIENSGSAWQMPNERDDWIKDL